ncbi:MAG: phospholipase D-like domain-containing protein [Chloroflexi bacterium]|nr:phospholipase D-like domain-containing protein [Chloroflexota bacterium]
MPAQSIPSGIRDNRGERGSVADFLREKIGEGARLAVVSAYFTIYAYGALKEKLEAIERLRFLFGEPRFVKSLDPEKSDKKAYKIEDGELRLSKRVEQRRAARECAEWIERKVDIRSVRQANLLHGKMYHVDNHGVEEAILGSSNFTVSGLGMAAAGNNIELNLIVDSNRDRQDLKAWFNELWEDSELVEDVKAEVLAYLAQLYQENAPEFIYFKTLYHIFEKFLEDQDRGGLADVETQIVDTAIWKALFEFQQDGAKGIIHKLQAYNGCILADSVGLGKTFEALAVIKYYELRNQRVLVLCPKKLRENWTVYQAQNNSELNPFLGDRFSYTVLCHTDLSRDGGKSGDIDLANINWGNYDLVVIDESHNFRNNNPGKKGENGNIIRRSRYQRLMEDIIRTGVKTKALMLSATPVNNDLKDLRNQIYFITENEDAALHKSMGIASIQETLRVAQLAFNDWARKSEERKTAELLDKLSSAFFKLLDGLTIARSRGHVKKYYQDSVAQLGGFPERAKPVSVYPQIDLHGEFLSYDRLNDEITRYQLSLFNPSRYVRAEFRALYEKEDVPQFSQAMRENYLIGMMKVNFLKRLESSVHSFDLTLRRTIGKMDELKRRIERFQQYQAENPEVDFGELRVEDLDDEELQEAFEVSKARFKMAHLDLDRWLDDLRRDREQLHLLELSACEISAERDAKLAELKRLIADKVKQPTQDKQGQPNRKTLVFTAFADTAAYLYDALKDWAQNEMGIHLAVVTGAGANQTTLGGKDFNQILINFSPVSKGREKMKSMPQEGEIDLLIATDCISEGQNLQDCDTLINYDIHWNPVRVIQRFGRIDRIGSINPAVRLVNFWPTQDLDKYIALKSRVEARMALVDLSATADDNLLNTEAIEDLITDEIKYRDRQLKRLREEVLDLEDFSESVTLSDFTLDDFRAELERYFKANEELLRDSPRGLYAVVPTDAAYPAIRPGVIFCLKQQGETQGSEAVNPLQPYFLVYILDEGVVRFNFGHPKQILENMRDLCSGKGAPYEPLCRLFNEQTQNGAEMGAYSELLGKAVKAIKSAYRKRAAGGLAAGRGAALPLLGEQVSEQSEFELVTWLVIR